MIYKVRLPEHADILTHIYYKQPLTDPYGQKMDDLDIWVCFNKEVLAWINEHVRVKSRLKLRQMYENRKVVTVVSFGSETDAIHFKMRWT